MCAFHSKSYTKQLISIQICFLEISKGRLLRKTSIRTLFQAILRLQGDAIDGLGEEKAAHAQVEFMKLDLYFLQSVMDFVEEFKRKEPAPTTYL